MTPLISVIVPVYNASKYLERCVRAVVAQTYSQWELILIDDGSTDNSLEIIRNFAASDDRIRAFHQENSGAGMARNKGIENAVGEYVVFLDSDDYISENYFSSLSSHDEDVVFIDVQDVNIQGNVIKREYMSSFKNYSIDDIIRFQMTGRLPWGGVRKAAKLRLLNEHNIRYSDHKVGEEALYSFTLLNNAKSVAFIELPLYNYVIREDSLSHAKLDDAWGPVAINLSEYIKSIDESEQKGYRHYANTINAFILTAFSGSTYRLCENYPYSQFVKKVKERRKLYFKQVDNKFPIDYQHMSIKARVLGFFSIYHLHPIVWIITKCYTCVHKYFYFI